MLTPTHQPVSGPSRALVCTILAGGWWTHVSSYAVFPAIVGSASGRKGSRCHRGRCVFALVTRSFHGRGKQLLRAMPCLAGGVPAHIAEIIVVLDDDPKDAFFAACVEAAAAANNISVRVMLEAMPPRAEEMFLPRLEGPAGKARTQWSNFYADRLTRSRIIGFFDAEVCLQAPILRPAVLSPTGQLRNTAFADGDAWGLDAVALGFDTPLDAMWTNRFPIWVWRSDLSLLRQHIARTLAPGLGNYTSDDAFDLAFAHLSAMPETPGAHALRTGYSQFNIMMNFAYAMRPQGYLFHAVPPRSVAALQESGSAMQRGAITSKAVMALGFNGHSEPAAAAFFCCEVHHGLAGCGEAHNLSEHARRLLWVGEPYPDAEPRNVFNRAWTLCERCIGEHVQQAREAAARQPADASWVQRSFCERLLSRSLEDAPSCPPPPPSATLTLAGPHGVASVARPARVCARELSVEPGPPNTCAANGARGIRARIRNLGASLRKRAAGAAPDQRHLLVSHAARFDELPQSLRSEAEEIWICAPIECEMPSREAMLAAHLHWYSSALPGGPELTAWSDDEVVLEPAAVSPLLRPRASTGTATQRPQGPAGGAGMALRKQATPDGTAARPSAAFCISGQARGFTRRGTYYSIQRNLIEAFGAPVSRVFWRIKAEEPLGGDWAAAASAMAPVASEHRENVRDDPPGFVELGCRSSRTWAQAKVMAECFDMVKAYEQEHGEFDYVFRVRTDSLFVRRFPHFSTVGAIFGHGRAVVARDMFFLAPRASAEQLMDLTPHWMPVDRWGLEIIFLEAIRQAGVLISYQCVQAACFHDWWIPPGEPGFRKVACLDFMVISRVATAGTGGVAQWNRSMGGAVPGAACSEAANARGDGRCWVYPNFAHTPERELRRAVESTPEDEGVDYIIDLWHSRPACEGPCLDFAGRSPPSSAAVRRCEQG